jgi:transcriptional regulator with XRE-family HTH domain
VADPARSSKNRPPRGSRPPNLNLKRERELRGWSQDDEAEVLSKVAAELGINRCVDKNTISMWENGHQIPCEDYRVVLCHVFKRSRAELGLPEKRIRRRGRTLKGRP